MGAQLCKQICYRQGESGDALGRRVLSELVGLTVVEKSTGRVAKLIDTDKSDVPCKLCYFDSVGQISWLREQDVFFLAAAEKYTLADIVGRTVLEKSSGRLAKLITTDSSDMPFKICYFDGVGDISWCREAELHFLSIAEGKELLPWVAALQQRKPQATAPSQAETVNLPAVDSWSDLEARFQEALFAAGTDIETTPPSQKAKAWATVEKLWAHSLEFSECFSDAVDVSISLTEKISHCDPPQFEIPLVAAMPSSGTVRNSHQFDFSASLQGEFLDSCQGHTVRMRNTGRIGKVIIHNSTGLLPYNVRFSEGDKDWFKGEDVEVVLGVGSLVKAASKGVGLIVERDDAKGDLLFLVQFHRCVQNDSAEWCREKCLSPVSRKKSGAISAEGAAHQYSKMPKAASANCLVRLAGPASQMPRAASQNFLASSGQPGTLPRPWSQVPSSGATSIAISSWPGFASAQIPPQRSAGFPSAVSLGQSVKIFRASTYGGQPLQQK